MSPKSKVWIYQSEREFSKDEVFRLELLLLAFCTQWTAHNKKLHAAGEIRHNRFIILMVDEEKGGASGCSIDDSVRFLKNIERTFLTQLFDRLQIAYMLEGKVTTALWKEFEQLVNKGSIPMDTLVFDNTVSTKSELHERWLVPINKSWMGKKLKPSGTEF